MACAGRGWPADSPGFSLLEPACACYRFDERIGMAQQTKAQRSAAGKKAAATRQRNEAAKGGRAARSSAKSATSGARSAAQQAGDAARQAGKAAVNRVRGKRA